MLEPSQVGDVPELRYPHAKTIATLVSALSNTSALPDLLG